MCNLGIIDPTFQGLLRTVQTLFLFFWQPAYGPLPTEKELRVEINPGQS
jgi:hypothetical protein